MEGKTFLFIDGTNLYAGQYKLFGPNYFLDFEKFINSVEDQINIKFDKMYFYASYSPKPINPIIKEKKYLKNEALFFKSVKRTKNVVFFTGYRSKTSGKEKEVDVKLTADIISFAFLDKYKSVFLLTGDADFLQALFSIKKFHNQKKINLLCLENKVMFQGLFFFRSYIIYFVNRPEFKRKFNKLSFIKLKKDELVSKI